MKNPLTRISLEYAKELGLYKGRVPKGPYEKETVVRKMFFRIAAYAYRRKIKRRWVRIKVKAHWTSRTYLFETPVKKKRIPKNIWLNVRTYQNRLAKSYDFSSGDLVYRRDANHDVISRLDGFVWTKPVKILGKYKNFTLYHIKPRVIRRHLYRATRVWFLLYHVASETYSVGSRSAAFPFGDFNIREALDWVEKLRKDVREYYEGEKFDDYIEFVGFLAYTLFFGGEKMPVL